MPNTIFNTQSDTRQHKVLERLKFVLTEYATISRDAHKNLPFSPTDSEQLWQAKCAETRLRAMEQAACGGSAKVEELIRLGMPTGRALEIMKTCSQPPRTVMENRVDQALDELIDYEKGVENSSTDHMGKSRCIIS